MQRLNLAEQHLGLNPWRYAGPRPLHDIFALAQVSKTASLHLMLSHPAPAMPLCQVRASVPESANQAPSRASTATRRKSRPLRGPGGASRRAQCIRRRPGSACLNLLQPAGRTALPECLRGPEDSISELLRSIEDSTRTRGGSNPSAKPLPHVVPDSDDLPASCTEPWSDLQTDGEAKARFQVSSGKSKPEIRTRYQPNRTPNQSENRQKITGKLCLPEQALVEKYHDRHRSMCCWHDCNSDKFSRR